MCFENSDPYEIPNYGKIFGGPPAAVLDPSKQKTYDLIESLLLSFRNLFPDEMVHLGGDEVVRKCFDGQPQI